jgi:hypothetical protein
MQEGGDEVGTGYSQRERNPGERPEAVQTLMRARRRYVRIAQEGTLREAQRETQEEIGGRQEKGSQILKVNEKSALGPAQGRFIIAPGQLGRRKG